MPPNLLPLAFFLKTLLTIVPYSIRFSKVNLRLALSRLKLQATKKRSNAKPQRREIAKMLSEAKEVTARALTEALIREERSLLAYDQLEIFCEQFLARLEAVSREKGMPTDLITCLCSVVYAAPRVDVEELKKVAANLELRYGTLWADSCHSNLHGQVHEKICDNLGIGRIKGSLVDAEMIKIAKEFDVDWSPLVPTPDEQDLNATLLAAQRLSDNGLRAPIPTSAGRKSPLLSNQPTVAKGSVASPSQYPRPSEESDYPSYGLNTSVSSPIGIRPTFTKSSPEPSAPSASPPLEYVRMNAIVNAGVEEELLMIDMLPDVPENRDISMDGIFQGNEGGIIVTHEHDDGEFEDNHHQQSKWIIQGEEQLDLSGVSDERKNVYEAVFAIQADEIPDSPIWDEPHVYHASDYPPHEEIAPPQAMEDEDPLVARMRRLKSLNLPVLY